MAGIHLETFIKAPAEICFDLARNVDVFTEATDHAGMRAIAGVTSGMMWAGDVVTWEVRALGLRQRSTSRITNFERPHLFVDEMQRGVFKRWRHEHRFASRQDGTLIIDEVTFASPFGVLGQLADALFLKNYMRRFLVKHNAHVKRLAESRDTIPARLT